MEEPHQSGDQESKRYSRFLSMQSRTGRVPGGEGITDSGPPEMTFLDPGWLSKGDWSS